METGINADLLSEIVARIATKFGVRLAGLSKTGNLMTMEIEFNFKENCWQMNIRSQKGAKFYYHPNMQEVVHFVMKVLVDDGDRWEKVQLMK